MKAVDVLGVRVEMPTNQPIVLLRERDGDRYLPIWIGAAEATAIAYAQQGVVPPRPLTHDLLKDIIEGLGHTVTQIRIVELRDKVFYALLVFDGGREISARPSDAIALALRTATQIVVAEAVLDEAGVALTPDEDDEVERFREFLDQVSAEDFEGGAGDPSDPSGDAGDDEEGESGSDDADASDEPGGTGPDVRGS
ncbi:bifunctional nuclease domain-containing protein [Lapillicoccus sp.]|uniref:bifunctional nuclease family protein n=1 Tax=Lapillicoccus sp. TaxID=1909287 RepID=UPI0025DA3588|nr:bifunctional nuclease domain-containing protein [Lapillicoccus sp.]